MDRLRLFAAVFGNLSDGAIVSDKRFRILYINPAAQTMMRLGEKDRRDMSICELLSITLYTPTIGRCGTTCPLLSASGKGDAASHQLEGLRVRCMRMPFGLTRGEEDLHLTLLEDNRAEVEFRRQQEDWRSMVTHDLRTPLSAMLGTFHLLKDRPAGAPVRASERNLIDISLASGRRMLDLLNLYLDISKLDAGMMPVRLRSIRLAETLRRCAEEQAALAAAHKVAVRMDVPDSYKVRADGDLLARVAQNLINNAIRYAGEGRRLSVSASKVSKGRVSVSLRDDGPGIARKDLAHLFDRFYQAEARRSGTTQGTGLGLTFCRQALEAMGGRIYVVSEPGSGSEFTFQLPSA